MGRMNKVYHSEVSSTMNKEIEETVERSEEVQEIIDRMPTRGAMYVIIITSILVAVVFLLGFFIKYSSTVDGEISVTAQSAPVRLVTNASGKIHLLFTDNASVKEGCVLAYVESGSNYKDILFIDSLLTECSNLETESLFPVELLLGEISSSFNSFLIANTQYCRMKKSDVYKIMRMALQQQISIDEKMIENLNRELSFKKINLRIEKEWLTKDSLLNQVQVISGQDLQRQQSSYLNLQASYEELHSRKLSRLSQISKNEQQLQQLILEERETLEKLLQELLARKNELMNTIRLWKEKYLLYSPIEGKVEYLGFWRENSFVQNGQELFSILPSQNEVVGEVFVPAYGVGKIEIGQIANVKVANYPFDEYGLIKGEVRSISRLSNKRQAPDGTSDDVYRVTISFPNGLKTNFGKTLYLNFESKGTVEIITKPKRLIERLFDNLKSKVEK